MQPNLQVCRVHYNAPCKFHSVKSRLKYSQQNITLMNTLYHHKSINSCLDYLSNKYHQEPKNKALKEFVLNKYFLSLFRKDKQGQSKSHLHQRNKLSLRRFSQIQCCKAGCTLKPFLLFLTHIHLEKSCCQMNKLLIRLLGK